MRIFCLVAISLFINSANASTDTHKCFNAKNVLCQKIVHLNPNINLDLAYKLSNYFHHSALKNDLSPDLLVAIAFQESSFNPKAINKVKGFQLVNDKYVETSIGADFCLMQINLVNIKKKGLSVKKILDDPKECIEAAVDLLVDFKKKYQEPDQNPWWTWYNSTSDETRSRYRRLVDRHLKKLTKFDAENGRSLAQAE